MLLSLGFTIMVCFVLSIAIVGTIWRSDGTIARILYETEHPERGR